MSAVRFHSKKFVLYAPKQWPSDVVWYMQHEQMQAARPDKESMSQKKRRMQLEGRPGNSNDAAVLNISELRDAPRWPGYFSRLR